MWPAGSLSPGGGLPLSVSPLGALPSAVTPAPGANLLLSAAEHRSGSSKEHLWATSGPPLVMVSGLELWPAVSSTHVSSEVSFSLVSL